ncbi:MAG: thymidylate synthase [Candidatus Handelsmanbacteria bacterium RIFCSPLOWO2_12_FULL_64_10]|uniref:Thymidylate synthase n=1 Tax=Handelsmanbacteria sp. (strain RIFCSPLOWO2_12_FULL_64_10) TaxID=1817868 RepID=A0A1F6C904_HANXR|nr:MAG: thymidylate synthase [Candidatus Handelsmanbacteria bacterium RIFCSPLOWO2_12_FULL_64_10]
MKTYLDQLQHVLDHGAAKKDRTGVGGISCFGLHARYRTDDGFPAVTTKQLVWKSMVSELLWFISGSGNIHDLKKIYPHNRLWDANYRDYLKRIGKAENDGSMGRIYGVQWRNWQGRDRAVDQLQEAIDTLRKNPDSRRIIVNAWNAAEVGPQEVALSPCHTFFQFYVSGDRLSLQMYQRSCDMFLGVPLNIASYSLLLHTVARITGLRPGEFIHALGDAHIYLNHVDAVKEQLRRTPYPLPELRIKDRGQKEIDDFAFDDFELVNYRHHPPIKAEMAV